MYFRLIAILVICSESILYTNADGLIEVFKWKQMDYYNRGNNAMTSLADNNPPLNKPPKSGVIYFPGQHYAVANNRQPNDVSFIPYNNVPMGVTHYKDRLFITVPRRRVGIPSTLNYIDLRKDGRQESPKLIAYPDFQINQIAPNSRNLVSVYRTRLDNCGRLWFIDTGMLEYPDNFMQIQRPSIWIMDLQTNKAIRRFEIPASLVAEGRGLASITPDTDKGCHKTFAYIPDLINNQLYVYSFEMDHIWAFEHNYFHFDPLSGDLNVGDITFSWNDGIFSVTLGPKEQDGTRNVLFHAMASHNEFIVNNQVLQNETNAKSRDYGKSFRLLGNRGEQSQSTIHAYDSFTNTVFYAEIQRNGVGCWNARKPFTVANHGKVANNAETMIYPSDLTIDEEGTMWIMTNSMPIFIYSTLDKNTFNFRIWKQNTAKAIENTICA